MTIAVQPPNDKEIFYRLNQAVKILTTSYGDEYVFGVFAYDDDYKIEGLIIPKFEDICINKPLISDTIEGIKVLDIRYIYQGTKLGHPEIIQSLYTDYYIVVPRYEFIFQRLLIYNRDKIKEGIKCGSPANELHIALTKILRTVWNDTSNAVRFIKQLTDAEKIALEGIIEVIGDEGVFFLSKVASATGVSRLTMTNLVQKMATNGVAIINYLGPKGTYMKILDGTLMNIRGNNNV